MAKKKGRKKKTPLAIRGYASVLSDISGLLDEARRASSRSVNAIMTLTYWEVGRKIVEFRQEGKSRADYGKGLLKTLSGDLTSLFGRGFSVDNLENMRRFYRTYPNGPKSETVSRKFTIAKSETLSRISHEAPMFPLPWSHYVRLLSVKKAAARDFYEEEAVRGGWSIRQLTRQIGSQFYERTAMSKNKAAMLTKGQKPRAEDAVTADEEIKDPFVLEFLNLKDEYSESDLEAALVRELEGFLLELGGDFTFVGRQRRLRIGDEWYRIDLLFFHRRLRCLVVIDLKLSKFTHADAGQMHMYLNYAREHWMLPDENPPVGLILCSEKNEMLAHYSLEGLPNKVLASEYKTALPDEDAIAAQLGKTKKLIEAKTAAKKKAKREKR